MALLLLTSPTDVPHEAELLNELFANGLERLHVRKPESSKKDYEALLKSIRSEFKKKVVLHQFHDLAGKYLVKGFHLREESRLGMSVSELESLKKEVKAKRLSLSSSFHSFGEVQVSGHLFDYVLLSPLFDSISKGFYLANPALSAIGAETLRNCPTKVIAMGGIREAVIPQVAQMGYDGVALLGAIWKYPSQAVNQFLEIKKTYETAFKTY